ncbi:MerR family transcriptional regulator [Cognatishimia sp. SS12]|uniref:MerR family transcriptional regulator n=1 Tax=Cognatishimia sp. SS12 TaxID=2979465 RepID=UPI00232FBC1E|nr:MerR family transcriptional regulator [Cognatishimia sp. SS12]MDC0737339.1 MerR family transcriptional regulator [Cognatishimia sp. SS12]
MAKSKDAFRTISEVADWLDVQPHVLRFWESKFTQVRPVKRAGGRRYYRPADMLLIGGIKALLHDEGMTIKGVQKLLREKGVKEVSALSRPLEDDDAAMLDAVDDTPIEAVPQVGEAPSAPPAADSAVTPARVMASASEDSPAPPAASAPQTKPAEPSDSSAASQTKAVPRKPVVAEADSWRLRRGILARLLELDHLPVADQPAISAALTELRACRKQHAAQR